jgi:ABC-type sugar transport system substrate-binding protein
MPRPASSDLVIVSGDALPMQLDALKVRHVQGLIATPLFAMGVAAADVLAKLAAGEEQPAKTTAPLGVCTVETADTCTAH